MQLLNTTFKHKSNVLCNKYIVPELTIGEMHETMERLYEAAEKLKGWVGQSDVARHLHQSPQTLNNWERRGMSKGGMLAAQRLVGCSAMWLETGLGSMLATAPGELSMFTPDQKQVMEMWSWLKPEQQAQLMEQMKADLAHNRAAIEALSAKMQTAKPVTETKPPPKMPATALRAGPSAAHPKKTVRKTRT